MWCLLKPLDVLVNVSQMREQGTYSTMHGQVLLPDEPSHWHAIETLHKHVIGLLVVLLYDLLAEGKVLGHRTCLMIATQQEKVGGEV